MFHLSHFHRLVSFCWFGFGCWGGFVCFAFAFFLSTDQSVRSSCQPMTSLAYFHDCHCRYDERSIVQKKKSYPIWPSPGSKFLDCTSQSPSDNGFSRAPLVSMTARTSTSQATARSPFRPSLRVTLVANSRSINSLPSLMPGKQRMTRNWMPLPLNVVR